MTDPLPTPDESRSERLSGDTGTAAPRKRCAFCRALMPAGRRPDALYCGTPCKRAAFNERAHEGHVRRVTLLANGKVSVVVHLDTDTGIRSGQTVRIGEV